MSVPGPHGGRPDAVRPGHQVRDPPPGRERGGRQLVAVGRARPRRRRVADRRRRSTDDPPQRRLEHRPGARADPLHARERITRRTMLERIGKFGAAAALAPVIAACTSGAATAAAASVVSAPAAAPARPAAPSVRRADAIPSPSRSCSSTTGPTTSARASSRRSRSKYGVKVTQDFFSNTEEAYAKLGDDGGGYDMSFPISVDIPAFVEKGALLPLDKTLLPNIVNLGTEWANPGYDPGNAHSVPVHVVDDRHRLRHDQGHRRADQQQGAVGPALRRPHLDARRLPGGLRAGPHPARLLGQHDRHRPAGRGPRPAPAAEAARPRVQHRHHRRR